MKQDQIEALQFMLDEHGVEGVLNGLADTLERYATKSYYYSETTIKRYRLQAEALRAQAAALAAGRALTYATQAPLEALASIRTRRFK